MVHQAGNTHLDHLSQYFIHFFIDEQPKRNRGTSNLNRWNETFVHGAAIVYSKNDMGRTQYIRYLVDKYLTEVGYI